MSKIWRSISKYSIGIIVVLVLVLLQILAELSLPSIMARIVDEGIVTGDTSHIISLGIRMILMAMFGTVSALASSYMSSRIGVGVGNDLRRRVFDKASDFSLKEFNHFGTASLITRTTNDITQIQSFVITVLRMFVRAPIMAIGGVFMVVNRDPSLSRLLIIVVMILVVLIILISKKSVPLFRQMQSKLDRLNLVIRERLTGVRVIRAFNKDESEKARFDVSSWDLTETSLKVNIIMASMMPLMMLILNLTVVALMWFGARQIDDGIIMVGDLMAFIQYAMHILFSLLMATMIFVMFPRAAVSWKRVNEVLEVEPEINDLDSPVDTFDLKGDVQFKNVSFRYKNASEPVIKNISFHARPSEVTAIIGGTGSGKSTIINLIPRFYDVTEGEILINGVPIRDISQRTLRGKIGYVPQKASLFSGTIKDNIAFGKELVDDESIQRAIEIAQGKDFVEGLKQGLLSNISQGGTNLSGGQRQRVAIARAFARNPEIYIFDDCFSALDYKTDANLRDAIKENIAGSTVLLVAQRVSTVLGADQIIVLDEGEIVGIGSHQELVNSCSVYRDIIISQGLGEELL